MPEAVVQFPVGKEGKRKKGEGGKGRGREKGGSEGKGKKRKKGKRERRGRGREKKKVSSVILDICLAFLNLKRLWCTSQRKYMC
jgi:hypothetical protein